MILYKLQGKYNNIVIIADIVFYMYIYLAFILIMVEEGIPPPFLVSNEYGVVRLYSTKLYILDYTIWC